MFPSRASVIEEFTSGEVLDVGVVQHDIENISEETWLHHQIYEFDGVKDVLGIDILEEEINTLQEMGYNVRKQNAENMKFDRKFDTIVAGELIEHLSNPGNFLKKSSKYLRSGGNLIISTPNTFNILRILFLIKNGYVDCNPEHTGWYDFKTLRQLAERYNLTQIYERKCTFKKEADFDDCISQIIRAFTPSAWTAETIVIIFTKK